MPAFLTDKGVLDALRSYVPAASLRNLALTCRALRHSVQGSWRTLDLRTHWLECLAQRRRSRTDGTGGGIPALLAEAAAAFGRWSTCDGMVTDLPFNHLSPFVSALPEPAKARLSRVVGCPLVSAQQLAQLTAPLPALSDLRQCDVAPGSDEDLLLAAHVPALGAALGPCLRVLHLTVLSPFHNSGWAAVGRCSGLVELGVEAVTAWGELSLQPLAGLVHLRTLAVATRVRDGRAAGRLGEDFAREPRATHGIR